MDPLSIVSLPIPVKTQIEEHVLGRWNFTSQLREGKTPQNLAPNLVETIQKEYTRRLTRRGNFNVLAHMIARSRKCIGNMADPENNHKARNSSPWFRIASRAQKTAMKKVFHTINHRDATAPASVITAKLHFYLRFCQFEPSRSRGNKSDKEERQKQGNNNSKHDTDA